MKSRFCFAALLLLFGAADTKGADGDRVGVRATEAKGSWERRASFGPGRIFHSALWTYSEVIVWGGGSEHQFYNSGGVYDPLTDKWRTITEQGAPSGRWAHAAVWTGTEMIIWGGRSSFSPQQHHRDGAIYDPRTDRWRPITTEGAPEARSQMAAVWTGEELIVWGGWSDGGKCPAVGGAYNPRLDRWTELPLEGAPQSRMEPGAVWTGREMIVWGGLFEGEQESAGTGARYNPETKKWTPLPMQGAPAPARGHQVVWTGTEMIVWGGAHLDANSPKNIGLNSGARYSPESDQWRPIKAPDEIEGRLYCGTVWDGSELIVWGGGDQEKGQLSTGARYNPETDQWRPIPTDGAPDARSMLTSIWIGDGMLIYGGSTGGSAAFDETHLLKPGAP